MLVKYSSSTVWILDLHMFCICDCFCELQNFVGIAHLFVSVICAASSKTVEHRKTRKFYEGFPARTGVTNVPIFSSKSKMTSFVKIFQNKMHILHM